MDPIIAFATITFTAVIYSAFSLHMSRTFGNRKRLKEIQDEMNRINNRLKAAMKSGDEKKIKEAEEEQARLPSLLRESMVLQFKPLIITLPIFFLLSWSLRSVFNDFVIKLAFKIPVFIQHFERFPNWRDEFGALGWFILMLIFSGLALQALVGRRLDRRR